MDMLQSAACCRVPDRWAFLYRVVWRWQHGEQVVLSAADEDGSRLHAMVKAVHREEHDMHAYIRFRERPEAAGAPRFVAWFEPAHDVLPQVAQHFVSRMGRISWMIATPDASVLWDGETLHNTGPLMSSAADLDDAGEALWLTYYRSIFNPARLNADTDAKPHPVALLEEPAGRRGGAGDGDAGRRRRAPHRPGRGGRPAARHHHPDRRRARRSRSARRRPRSTSAAAASCGSTRPRRSAAPGRSRAHHAGRRAAGRPGRPGRRSRSSARPASCWTGRCARRASSGARST